VNTKTDRALDVFRAADPARTARPDDELARVELYRAIVNTPRSAVPTRRRRRWQRRGLGLGIAIVALVGAGSVAALNGGLPLGNDNVIKSAEEARAEIRAADREIPVAPGQRDPGPGELDANATYAQGAAAGQLLFRRMCTWDKSLLEAIASRDAATFASTKAELARPLWYRYFAPSSAAVVRTWHVTASVVDHAQVSRFYAANCADVTGALEPPPR
jgi:hypothetical protein